MKFCLTMVVSLALLASSAVAQDEAVPPRLLTVTGDGEASDTPDEAVVQVGAVFQADNAAASQAKVNEIMQKTIDDLVTLGIEKKDLQTAQIEISPVYAGEREQTDQGPRVVGYRASSTLRVDVEEIARVGEVIDAAVRAGANQVHSVSFYLKDDENARERAIKKAVAQAQQKADLIAEAMNLTLDSVYEVSEVQMGIGPGLHMGYAMAEARTPVQPGEIEVRASVTVRYRIGNTGLAGQEQ